jgi:hypothetical protein
MWKDCQRPDGLLRRICLAPRLRSEKSLEFEPQDNKVETGKEVQSQKVTYLQEKKKEMSLGCFFGKTFADFGKIFAGRV